MLQKHGGPIGRTMLQPQKNHNRCLNMKLQAAIETTRDVIRRKHLAHSTEENYLQWINRFARFVAARCAGDAKPEQKMEAFLTQLARQDVSASTQNQAFCAILFFYREVLKVEIGKIDSLRAKKPVRLRYSRSCWPAGLLACWPACPLELAALRTPHSAFA